MNKVNKKFRIAVIAPCPFPYSRGTPVRIYEIAKELSELGHDVHVFTYHLGHLEKEANFNIHRIKNIPGYEIYSPGPNIRKLFQLDLLLTSLLIREFRENSYDVIHAHNYEGLLIGLIVKKMSDIPLVYDAHNTLESELPYYYNLIPKFVKRWTGIMIDKIISRNADHIIAVTPDIKTKLVIRHKIKPEFIDVVGNGADIEHFKKTDFNTVKHDAAIKKNILYAGNTASYQRIDLLLEIFRLIKSRNENVYLNIVTNSCFDEYSRIAEKMSISQDIRLFNADYSMQPEIFNSSDVALSTRIDCDGIPLKLLNYMSAGLPVVSFEGSAKIIIHNETGMIVKNGDTIAFADSVLELLNNDELSRKIGSNGYEYVKRNHSWKHTAESICRIYDGLID